MRETLFTLLIAAGLGFHAPLCSYVCSSEASVAVARDLPPCHTSDDRSSQSEPAADDCASCEELLVVAAAQPPLQAPALVPIAAFSLVTLAPRASSAVRRQAPPPPTDGLAWHDVLLEKSTLLL